MTLPWEYLKRTGYRLPTEAEWEYACRAGSSTARHFGETELLLGQYAWYQRNSGDKRMLAVGSLKPNDAGLFDMLKATRHSLEPCRTTEISTFDPCRSVLYVRWTARMSTPGISGFVYAVRLTVAGNDLPFVAASCISSFRSTRFLQPDPRSALSSPEKARESSFVFMKKVSTPLLFGEMPSLFITAYYRCSGDPSTTTVVGVASFLGHVGTLGNCMRCLRRGGTAALALESRAQKSI